MKGPPKHRIRLNISSDRADNIPHRDKGNRRAQRSAASVEEPIGSSADEIGYRKPPRQHKWRKGQSGNPAGRQKGSRNKRTIIVRLMEEKLGRKIDDVSKLTRHEAMVLKGIQKALAGDTRAMAFILRRYDDAADAQTITRVATEHDEAVYAALVEKIRRELKETG